MQVTRADIDQAREKIRAVIRPTEMLYSEAGSKELGKDLFIKFENTQHTGSFKLRGAYNKISSLTPEQRAKGVVASSAGNHAQGVAFCAAKLGVRCQIVMPMNAPLIKVESTQAHGAKVVLHGEIYDDAYEKAREIEKNEGMIFIPPYEDPLIIAGQGTIGLEMMEFAPQLDTLVVAIGGGGLISGIAIAAKSINPKLRVIGVQSDQADNIARLFHKKEPVVAKGKLSTIADGIAVKQPSKVMFESFISKFIDDVVTVSDDDIAEAIVFLLEKHKSVAEGAGAAAMGAVLAKKAKLGQKNAVVIGGGNIDLNLMEAVIHRGLIRKGRVVELSVVVDDLPGNLNRLTNVLAENRANVLDVHHDRVSDGVGLRQTKITFVIETINRDHVSRIRTAFKQAGARLTDEGMV